MKTCENCGHITTNGYCPNCDEEVFIMDQYNDLVGTEHELPFPSKDSEFMRRYNKSIHDHER